ncbi:tripartite tricarboxylate transporter substrate binding protein [Propylenella binzhouense]|nr:tripartite tricarboxylate transporter substrate binding protein [Propylenella binzhouense]
MHLSKIRKTVCASLVALAALAGPAAAEFPEKPIKLVVPFGQGGATDQMARLIAPLMEKELGQPIVLINQPGAGGAVGLANLAHARPDGYTIGVGSDSTLAARPLMSKSGYTAESFATIARVVEIPSGVAVRSDSPYKSLGDLVAAMKTKDLTWSSSGIGSGPHLAMAVFLAQNGLKATYVNSNSGQEAMVKLLSGEVAFLSAGGSNFPPMLEDGKGDIRVLGLAAEKRWTYLPDVPTYKEQGFDYLRSQWFGLVAPAGTPDEAVAKMSAAVKGAVENPEFEKRLGTFYFNAAYQDPKTMRGQIEKEAAELKPVLEQAGLVQN